MHISSYLREGTVYIPTLRQVPGSYYFKTAPVQVAPASDIAAVTEAFEQAIRLGNPSITEAECSTLPKWITVAPTGVNSWRAFERGALTWSLDTDPKTGEYRMRLDQPQAGGGWTPGLIPAFTLPADTPTSEVARRAAEVIYDTAESQSQS